MRLLTRMIQQDPSDKVRDKAAFGLSVSKVPSALSALIAAAKTDKSTHVRGQALFWLAQKAGKEAVAAIADAIDRDPETDVKKKAVFALSQLPTDEGVPRLIDVARNNRNPEGTEAGVLLARSIEGSPRTAVLRGHPAEEVMPSGRRGGRSRSEREKFSRSARLQPSDQALTAALRASSTIACT